MDFTMQPLTLYGYWRSNATYRIRVALNLKGVAYREVPIDLDKGEQRLPAFLAQNPMGAVPALVIGEGAPLTQSLAILDYIEERYPAPPLLPKDLEGRARVRALSADVACDSHPLITPRVRRWLTTEAGFDQDAFRRWMTRWVGQGLEGIDAHLSASPWTGRFCHGDAITTADICVTGLSMIQRLFKLDAPETPTLTRIVETCLAEPAFAAAHPMNQADSPKAG